MEELVEHIHHLMLRELKNKNIQKKKKNDTEPAKKMSSIFPRSILK